MNYKYILLISIISLLISIGCTGTAPTSTPTPAPTSEATLTPTPNITLINPTFTPLLIITQIPIPYVYADETLSYRFDDFQRWVLDNRRGYFRNKTTTHYMFTIDFEDYASESGYNVYGLELESYTPYPSTWEGIIIKLDNNWYFIDPQFNNIVPIDSVYGYYQHNFEPSVKYEKARAFYYHFNNPCVIKGLTDDDGWIKLKEIYEKKWLKHIP